MIRIESDWSEVDAEIDRLSRMPNGKAKALLGGVLSTGLASVIADTHVDTGSLKSSVRKEVDTSKATQTWEGTIHAGGPSKGVNNPVDYAIYEKRRGGVHDFFKSLPTLHPAYMAALKEALRG